MLNCTEVTPKETLHPQRWSPLRASCESAHRREVSAPLISGGDSRRQTRDAGEPGPRRRSNESGPPGRSHQEPRTRRLHSSRPRVGEPDFSRESRSKTSMVRNSVSVTYYCRIQVIRPCQVNATMYQTRQRVTPRMNQERSKAVRCTINQCCRRWRREVSKYVTRN